MSEALTLLEGLTFPEQPRWRDGRLWFSDWGTREVISVDPRGNSEVVLRGPSFPLCVDWLPDGRLLGIIGGNRQAEPVFPRAGRTPCLRQGPSRLDSYR